MSFAMQFSASRGRIDDDVSNSWGRILSSTGSTPLSTPLDPNLVSVTFIPSPRSSNPTPLVVLENGEPVGVDEARASEILGEEDFEIRVDLGGQGVGGKENAKYWTCDFSYVSVSASEVRRWEC